MTIINPSNSNNVSPTLNNNIKSGQKIAVTDSLTSLSPAEAHLFTGYFAKTPIRVLTDGKRVLIVKELHHGLSEEKIKKIQGQGRFALAKFNSNRHDHENKHADISSKNRGSEIEIAGSNDYLNFNEDHKFDQIIIKRASGEEESFTYTPAGVQIREFTAEEEAFLSHAIYSLLEAVKQTKQEKEAEEKMPSSNSQKLSSYETKQDKEQVQERMRYYSNSFSIGNGVDLIVQKSKELANILKSRQEEDKKIEADERKRDLQTQNVKDDTKATDLKSEGIKTDLKVKETKNKEAVIQTSKQIKQNKEIQTRENSKSSKEKVKVYSQNPDIPPVDILDQTHEKHPF